MLKLYNTFSLVMLENNIMFLLKTWSHECRIGQRTRNELLLTHEKRMTLTKEKSNTHKQRKLPNDELPVK